MNSINRNEQKSPMNCAASARTADISVESETTIPIVYNYNNYRNFLSDWFQYQKKQQTNFSGARFAKAAGYSSSPLLGMVIRGDRNLSSQFIRAFIRGLSLAENEGRYFETLVLLNQSDTQQDKDYYRHKLEQLTADPNINRAFHKLGESSEFVQSWSFPIIRELIDKVPAAHSRSIPNAAHWLFFQLYGTVSISQIEQNILRLIQTGLIREREKGGWTSANGKVVLDPKTKNRDAQLFHRAFLSTLAQLATHIPQNAREFGFITLSVSSEEFDEIREEVRQFWQGILAKYPRAPKRAEQCIALSVQALKFSANQRTKETEKKAKKI